MDIKSMLLLLLIAALPVAIILIFIYLRDKNKEPLTLLIVLFLSGFISCVLVLIISEFLSSFLPFMNGIVEYKPFIDILLYAFVGVALVEEICKWIMVFIVSYNSKEFDEIYDGIVYCIFVALGFAFIENILYVVQTTSVKTALLRAVTAVPSHAFDAVFMGHYISMAKQCGVRQNRKKERKYLYLSILVPTLLHGVYDFCLMSGYEILTLFFLTFVIFLYVICIGKIKKVSDENKRFIFKSKFCGNCGRAVIGEYCAGCGQPNQ